MYGRQRYDLSPAFESVQDDPDGGPLRRPRDVSHWRPDTGRWEMGTGDFNGGALMSDNGTAQRDHHRRHADQTSERERRFLDYRQGSLDAEASQGTPAQSRSGPGSQPQRSAPPIGAQGFQGCPRPGVGGATRHCQIPLKDMFAGGVEDCVPGAPLPPGSQAARQSSAPRQPEARSGLLGMAGGMSEEFFVPFHPAMSEMAYRAAEDGDAEDHRLKYAADPETFPRRKRRPENPANLTPAYI